MDKKNKKKIWALQRSIITVYPEGKIIIRKTKCSETESNSDTCSANGLTVFNILNFKIFSTYTILSL